MTGLKAECTFEEIAGHPLFKMERGVGLPWSKRIFKPRYLDLLVFALCGVCAEALSYLLPPNTRWVLLFPLFVIPFLHTLIFVEIRRFERIMLLRNNGILRDLLIAGYSGRFLVTVLNRAYHTETSIVAFIFLCLIGTPIEGSHLFPIQILLKTCLFVFYLFILLRISPLNEEKMHRHRKNLCPPELLWKSSQPNVLTHLLLETPLSFFLAMLWLQMGSLTGELVYTGIGLIWFICVLIGFAIMIRIKNSYSSQEFDDDVRAFIMNEERAGEK